MKVILNKDLSPLGEEGDVKDVARGYARNYLFPRSIALPYNEQTIRLFESRREEIEGRKAEKREAARGLKERLEALELSLSMPAGANGRLFGSVTSQTVMDELARQGFQIERKRIELPGTTFKSVGRYKVTIHLYESAAAEVTVVVQALVEKAPETPASKGRRRREEGPAVESAAPEAAVSAESAASPEAAAPESGTDSSVSGEAPVSAEAEASPEEAAPESASPEAAADSSPAESGGEGGAPADSSQA
jgi:large subunit ribosomal protein L9